MTAYYPISYTVPQYEDSDGSPYSGGVLKAYTAGTSNPISMATDYTGNTTVATATLNASGFPEVSGNEFIPHLAENYKLALYPDSTSADADSGEIWSVDDIQIASASSTGSLTNVASASTINLNSTSTGYFNITGTTGISTITLTEGVEVRVKFASSLTITNGAFLINLTGDDITTGAGDIAVFRGEAGSVVRMVDYSRASGSALSVPQGHLTGLTLSNDTDTDHDINILAGQASDSTNASYLTLAAETTKQIDATWSAGDDAGGLFTGTVANDTTYHVFLIEKDSDGTIDAGFDTSVTAANIPSGYTKYRRIGSILTDGSANIIKFHQDGDRFTWDVPVQSTTTVPTTTAATIALNVPTGITVGALIFNYSRVGSSAVVYSLITSLSQTDTLPTSAIHNNAVGATTTSDTTNGNSTLQVQTNTSGQVRQRASSAPNVWFINTLGWVDNRGR